MENQNILQHLLPDLLRDTRRIRSQLRQEYESHDHFNLISERTLPPVQSNVLLQMQNYPEIPLDSCELDFSQLISIFKLQDAVVQEAICIGEDRRRRRLGLFGSNAVTDGNISDFHNDFSYDGNVRAWRLLYNHIQARSNEEDQLYESALSCANRRITVDEINRQIVRLIKQCKEGDIIDIAGYRGTGYYFVISNDIKNGIFKALKTCGQFGCHLPSVAWETIFLNGLSFFEKADIWGCYLPKGVSVEIKSSGKRQIVSMDDQILYTWLIGSDLLMIDGKEYKGELWEMPLNEQH